MILLAIASALAEVRRFAVIVGNNEGFAGSQSLYFAEQDAKKMKNVLTTLGGVEEGDVRLLLGRNRNELLTTLGLLRTPITDAKLRGDETVLYFYYSGHGDKDQLQLGRTWVTWDELTELLEKSGAHVRVAFVDACQSGSMTRQKGGTMAESFVGEVSERLDWRGSYFMTSSAGDESSQESNEIGGSYFTHFLASALAGTGDVDGDGKVTLNEAYDTVYQETVYRTSTTRGGAQHPMQDSSLSGSGDLVVTELDRPGGTLIFPGDNVGTYAVFDVDRRMFVAEVDVGGSERRLSVRPGHYLVQRRFPTHLAVADVSVGKGASTRVLPTSFRALEYEDDVAKGSVAKVIREGNLPKVSIRGILGGRGFGPEAQAQYFPSTPAAGVDARLHWRDGRWASVDVLAGTGTGDLAFSGLPYTIPVRVDTAAVGFGAGYATPMAPFRFGGGLRVQGIWLRRSFVEEETAPQELFTVAPGLCAWGGWYPRRFELEIGLHTHYLPYIVDGRDKGMAYNELLLSVGYRF